MKKAQTPRCLECDVEISPRTRTGLCTPHNKAANHQKLKANHVPEECSNPDCFRVSAYGRSGMCDICYMNGYRGRNPRIQERAYAPASYKQTHIRLARHVGKASLYKCIDCGGQAVQWSWVGECDEVQTDGKLSWCRHEEHYFPRCISDHKLYDLGLIKSRRQAGLDNV